MKLNSKTLENLEIFQNMVSGILLYQYILYVCVCCSQENKRENNTLFWVLNHTKTPFGRRLLHRWTAHPLRRLSELQLRQSAVSELSSSESLSLSLLKKLVSKLPDLEKMLCSAYHKKVIVTPL